MLRWPKRQPEPEYEPLTQAEIIRSYQRNHQANNAAGENYYLSILAENAKRILLSYGIRWDEHAIQFLQDMLIRFNVFTEQDFWDYFILHLRHKIGFDGVDKETAYQNTVQALAYENNGFGSYVHKNFTSVPEDLTVNHLNGIVKAPIDPEDEYDNGQSDQEISDLIDSLLFN